MKTRTFVPCTARLLLAVAKTRSVDKTPWEARWSGAPDDGNVASIVAVARHFTIHECDGVGSAMKEVAAGRHGRPLSTPGASTEGAIGRGHGRWS